jgi:hypothetical protein
LDFSFFFILAAKELSVSLGDRSELSKSFGKLRGSGAIEFFVDVADGSTSLEQSSKVGALKTCLLSVLMCDQPKRRDERHGDNA